MIRTILGITTAALLATSMSANAHDTDEPNRWLVTLEHLEPLTVEQRMFVVGMLGIEIDAETLDQAIQEAQVPLEVFGGED